MNHESADIGPLLREVYRRLREEHGAQNWWPADSAFEVAVGAILTQSVAWSNVEKALSNLKSAGVLSPKGLWDVPVEELAALIRPSGYFNVKARRLKAFAERLWTEHQGSLEGMFAMDAASLREELLSIHGIGEETADDIILYAAGKPLFVIDAYTRRVVDRLRPGCAGPGYGEYQRLFHDALPKDSSLFNEYHALLVRHGKHVCRKTPRCGECRLVGLCVTGGEMAARNG